MYPLLEEYLVEERRRDIRREMSQIHLEEVALRGKVFHPNWFTRAMQTLGQWLIARGERLVKRYETPQPSPPQSDQSYAH